MAKLNWRRRRFWWPEILPAKRIPPSEEKEGKMRGRRQPYSERRKEEKGRKTELEMEKRKRISKILVCSQLEACTSIIPFLLEIGNSKK